LPSASFGNSPAIFLPAPTQPCHLAKKLAITSSSPQPDRLNGQIKRAAKARLG
jgi:hypothetical protein